MTVKGKEKRKDRNPVFLSINKVGIDDGGQTGDVRPVEVHRDCLDSYGHSD